MVLHSHSEKAFCVGADLKERKGMNREETIATLDLLRACMDGIACFPMPTIAVVEGFALGGGLELALSCDMRIFSPNAKVGLSEASLGIIPGAGGTQRLSRLIGVARAKEVIFKAERISGESAMELGICNACDGEAYNLAEKWANQIANNAPLSLRYSKEAIDMGSHLELSQGLDCERQSYLSVLDSEDRIEGLKAFAEKRNPNYQGK